MREFRYNRAKSIPIFFRRDGADPLMHVVRGATAREKSAIPVPIYSRETSKYSWNAFNTLESGLKTVGSTPPPAMLG